MVLKYFKPLIPILMVGMVGCNGDDTEKIPDIPLKNKTVLAYIMGDVNLWFRLEQMLNDMEEGWEDDTDGNMIVYLDKSPHLTQFLSPVLLKIRHDETDRIVSEVVKYYPDQDSGDPEVMQRVLSETIELFPAKTQGLIIASHGNGWIPGNAEELLGGQGGGHEDATRGIAGPDRYGSTLEIDDIARLLPVKYEFILFHACMMGNIETAYELKDKCTYMVGCSEPLPGLNLPFGESLPYLFTTPRADLYRFSLACADWYGKLADDIFQPLTLSVIQTDRLDALAERCRAVLPRFAVSPAEFYGNLAGKVYAYGEDGMFSDLYQVFELQCADPEQPEEDMARLFTAIEQAVPLQFAVFRNTEGMLLDPDEFCGLSCYVPRQGMPILDKLQEYYRTHYKWATASGFDLLIAK